VLVRLLEDGPLRESLGRRARDRAADFSWDRVVALHERAYETAMQRAS
jgi:glycosyltransferase involved in cell wall biosynthesis